MSMSSMLCQVLSTLVYAGLPHLILRHLLSHQPVMSSSGYGTDSAQQVQTSLDCCQVVGQTICASSSELPSLQTSCPAFLSRCVLYTSQLQAQQGCQQQHPQTCKSRRVQTCSLPRLRVSCQAACQVQKVAATQSSFLTCFVAYLVSAITVLTDVHSVCHHNVTQ